MCASVRKRLQVCASVHERLQVCVSVCKCVQVTIGYDGWRRRLDRPWAICAIRVSLRAEPKSASMEAKALLDCASVHKRLQVCASVCVSTCKYVQVCVSVCKCA